MKGLVLAAAGAAVIGLAACSHTTTPRAAAPTGNGTGTPIAPVSCGQQYRTWTDGEGKGLMGTFNTVSTAATARDAQALTAALKQARPAVNTATRHPIPACADPMGYWSVLLMHVNAAVASKGPASSVRAAIQDVPKIHQKLVAEVKQTAK
jgi:hypothetical protein